MGRVRQCARAVVAFVAFVTSEWRFLPIVVLRCGTLFVLVRIWCVPTAALPLLHARPSHSRHPQITFVGLCLIIMSHTMLAWFDPDLTGNAPSWVFALQGICLFVYSTLDNMDGKQARRTGSSSSLGLLFDHGMRRCLPLPATACCCVLTHAQHRLRCRQRRHAVGDVVLLRNRSASAPTP